MAQQDNGKMKMLHSDEDILNARFAGMPIFREGDHVTVRNLSLGSQPDGRFVITLIRDSDMVLMGVPKALQTGDTHE